MKRKISRAGRWSALLIAVTLVVTGCTDDAEKPLTGQVDLNALRTIAAGLPADPAEAAVRLVAEVYGDSPERSAAATAELLRRAGLPVVSAKGPVVGIPDNLTLLDAPVYAELIPLLARATRAGDRYTVDQFATLLTAVGLTEKPLHTACSRGEHVTLTATARFDLKMAAEKLECYALAGVDLPKGGPMEGLTVRWSSSPAVRRYPARRWPAFAGGFGGQFQADSGSQDGQGRQGDAGA